MCTRRQKITKIITEKSKKWCTLWAEQSSRTVQCTFVKRKVIEIEACVLIFETDTVVAFWIDFIFQRKKMCASSPDCLCVWCVVIVVVSTVRITIIWASDVHVLWFLKWFCVYFFSTMHPPDLNYYFLNEWNWPSIIKIEIIVEPMKIQTRHRCIMHIQNKCFE